MQLAEYLAKHDLKDHEFAERIGFGRTSVLRWRKGEMFPDPAALRAIFAATSGDVTANDFFHAAVNEGAAA